MNLAPLNLFQVTAKFSQNVMRLERSMKSNIPYILGIDLVNNELVFVQGSKVITWNCKGQYSYKR